MTLTVSIFGCKSVADLATTIKKDHSRISKNVPQALGLVLSEDLIETHGQEFSDFLISRFEGGYYDTEQAVRVRSIWNIIKLKEGKLHELFDSIFEAHKKSLLKGIKLNIKLKTHDNKRLYLKQTQQVKAFEDGLKSSNYAGLKQLIDDLIAGKSIQEYLLNKSQEETIVKLESDETIVAIESDEAISGIEYNYSQERKAQRKRGPEFAEQYAFNDALFESGELYEGDHGRIHFKKIGKYIEGFNNNEQAVLDVFKNIEGAIGIWKYDHSSPRTLTHQEVYFIAFMKYVADNGGIERNDSKQLTKTEIVKEYCSIYPSEWAERKQLAALQDACPQLFGIRHVIDEIPQVLRLERHDHGQRKFYQYFGDEAHYGIVLGGNT